MELAAGDTLGIAFDQASFKPEVRFYKNGKPLPDDTTVKGMKGVVRPAIQIDAPGSVKLYANVSCSEQGFQYNPPAGFSGIILARSVV